MFIDISFGTFVDLRKITLHFTSLFIDQIIFIFYNNILWFKNLKQTEQK